MRSFSVDWLGRCGPHQLIVELTPDEVHTRLKMSLVSESILESAFAVERSFSGKLRGDTFAIRPCWRSRRSRPILTGEIEDENGDTCIRFQIGPDPLMLYSMLLGPGVVLIASVVFMLAFDRLMPFCIMPVILPVVLVLNMWFARNESKELLRFFLDLFSKERLN